MADNEKVLNLCTHTVGQRSEASGPPVKRFRGVDAGEESSHGGPRATEEQEHMQGGFLLEGPSQMGSVQHIPPAGIPLGSGPTRHIPSLSPRRLVTEHAGPFEAGLWGEPQPMLGEEPTSSGMDAPMNTTLQAPPLHWARKSQRQSRSNQRQQLGGGSDLTTDEAFPPRLSTPNFPWVPPEHRRIPTLLGVGRVPIERPLQEPQIRGPRGPRGIDAYTFDYEMDEIDLFGRLGSMEHRETVVGPNTRVNPSLVGPRGEGGRGSMRRLNRRHRLRETDGPRLRPFMPREEVLDDMDDPLVPPPHRNPSYHAAVHERIRQIETRRALEFAREQAREQTRDAFLRRRVCHQQRDGRGSSLREEFGALMNVLGLVSPVDSSPENAMLGITRSGLPPHLLFTDRDFTGEDYEWLCRLDDGLENRKGADDDTINKLPTTKYEDTPFQMQFQEPNVRCPICLEEFSEGETMRVMPCTHNYHKECLDKWLKMKAVCPICNLNIRKDV